MLRFKTFLIGFAFLTICLLFGLLFTLPLIVSIHTGDYRWIWIYVPYVIPFSYVLGTILTETDKESI